MTDKPSIGRVTGVRSKNGETFVDVEMGPTRSEPDVRLAGLAPGLLIPPKEGQKVEVYETERGLFARFSHSPPEFSMPSLNEDSFVLRFNENTELLFSNDGNNNYTVKLRGTDVVIDGNSITLGDGSAGVVTDINTTTNTDGYVTDVTPVYSNKIDIQ